MKWGGYNRNGEKRIRRVFRTLFGAKGTWYMLTLAVLALLLAQNIKWHP